MFLDYASTIFNLVASLFPIPYFQILVLICLYLLILWIRLKNLSNKRPRITYFRNTTSYPFISTFPNEVST